MMNSSAKPNEGDQGNFAIYLGLLLVGGAIYSKVAPKLALFWQTYHFQLLAFLILVVTGAVAIAAMHLWNRWVDTEYRRSITRPDPTSVLLGDDEKGNTVHLKQAFRSSHAQVIGTTNAGKTESVVLPWAIRDIENGSGLLIVDGKSDSSFLSKLYSYIVKSGREKDFRLFSLVHRSPSTPFNPFIGASAQEAAERVFSSFPIEHSHYRAVQSKLFLALVSLIHSQGRTPSFSLIHELLTDPEKLGLWVQNARDPVIQRILGAFLKQSDRDRGDQVSGLEANLAPFAYGDHAELFNCQDGGIQFDLALREGHICYFQLPTMLYPFLGEATGKLVLQSFQSAVARRQVGLNGKLTFFSCYLDDFQDYIYRGFGALLNKSRSANVGIVFSHQALGDLDKVGSDFRNVVLTNTNIKIVMRSNDPETCEYFAKSFGTKRGVKTTERRKSGPLGETKTGDGSVREVEQYIYHPNEVRQLGTGQGIVAIPHARGVKTAKVTFQRRPDLPPIPIPDVPKENLAISADELLPSITDSSKNRL